MDSANIERISKALANETRVLIFEAIARNKEMTSNAILPSYSCLK
jgi:DNA-binding transcriptional ArsR family regulator